MGDHRTITIDRERCIGSGLCLVYAPGTFEHDEEAKAVVVESGGDPLELIRTAVEACPTNAIQLVPNGGD